MEDNDITKIQYQQDAIIKNLDLEMGLYIVFCSDGKGYYHMVPIIDNVVYDRKNECLDLRVISIYKKIKEVR